MADKVSDHDWQLIPNSEGKMHLVDISNYDAGIEPAFNAWTDVIFTLFTRNNQVVGDDIQLNNIAQLFASNFNPFHPTR